MTFQSCFTRSCCELGNLMTKESPDSQHWLNSCSYTDRLASPANQRAPEDGQTDKKKKEKRTDQQAQNYKTVFFLFFKAFILKVHLDFL